MRNMPAPSPYTSPEQQTDLERLGARLRGRRKALGVTVVACAEAAGVSRVTLHRVEAGNPSVTIGAYVNVAAALGLHLVVPILDAPAAEPVTITVGDTPASARWHGRPMPAPPSLRQRHSTCTNEGGATSTRKP
jgi:transcriptional regulator with XRE-family HTH domain